MVQFLGESLLLTGIALLIALALVRYISCLYSINSHTERV